MELKSGEGTVVVADRDSCCNEGCNRNSGWGSGWGAVAKKSSALSKTRLKTRKSLVSTEW